MASNQINYSALTISLDKEVQSLQDKLKSAKPGPAQDKIQAEILRLRTMQLMLVNNPASLLDPYTRPNTLFVR